VAKEKPVSKTPIDASGSYGQLCPVSLALDWVGPRWALLLLRDLARTPLRFSDLTVLNPGISPAVLTARLRSLQGAGILEKHAIRGPGRSTVYAIAEARRRAITAILIGLADLGSDLVDANPPRVDPVEGYYLFDLTGWQNHIIIEDGTMTILDGPPEQTPDATAAFRPPTTLMRITAGVQSIEDAKDAGQLEISGDQTSMIELLRLLSVDVGG